MTYPVDPTKKPAVEAFFDEQTNTFSYVVADTDSRDCIVVDPVLELDYASGRTSTSGAERIVSFIKEKRLNLQWIVETHVHADHLSGASFLVDQLGGSVLISDKISSIQEFFAGVFNDDDSFARDGSQFSKLLSDGDTYSIGSITAFAMYTPGHTPACMVHVIGDAVFVGDTLFMPDSGSARADFPGGDSGQLYDSIQKILALPDDMRVFVCHDYGPNGRAVRCETTVGEQRQGNIHVGAGRGRSEFVKLRSERDATLAMPRLILPSLQVNIRGGEIPRDPEGRPMLKVPLDAL